MVLQSIIGCPRICLANNYLRTTDPLFELCSISNREKIRISCNYNHDAISPLCTRLAGFPPFWHRKRMVMLRDIMGGRYEFVSPEWDDISEGPKDLVSGYDK